MTAPGQKRTYAGFRHCQIMKINSSGYPDATSTQAYDGEQLEGVNTLTINSPEPRPVTHRGDDRPYQIDLLPPTDPISAVLTASKMNDTMDELLNGDKSFTVGDARMMLVGSNNQGNESAVAILAFAQALEAGGDANQGERRWEGRLFPDCFVHRRDPGFGVDQLQVEMTYTVTPKFVTKLLWGVSLATATHGATRAQGVRMVTEGKPHVVCFKAGAQLTYTFPTNPAPNGTAKMKVWDNGAIQTYTTDFTANTTTLFLAATPTTGNFIVVLYEYN